MITRPESKVTVFHGQIQEGAYTARATDGDIVQSNRFPYMQVIHCDGTPLLTIKIGSPHNALTVRVPWSDTADQETELDALIAVLITARDRIRDQGL